MPCAAGLLCALKSDHTTGPPHFTNHKCRVCGGFLHGLCGVKGPLSDNEMHRVCHPCVTSTTRKESGVDTAVGAAKRHCSEGARSTMKRVDTTARRKARGADNRERRTFFQQRGTLDLLKTMTGVAVAEKMKIGLSTAPSTRGKRGGKK